jgi:hypothetical protein
MCDEFLLARGIHKSGAIVDDSSKVMQVDAVAPSGGTDLESIENSLHADGEMIRSDTEVVIADEDDPRGRHRLPSQLARLPLDQVYPEPRTSERSDLPEIRVVRACHRQRGRVACTSYSDKPTSATGHAARWPPAISTDWDRRTTSSSRSASDRGTTSSVAPVSTKRSASSLRPVGPLRRPLTRNNPIDSNSTPSVESLASVEDPIRRRAGVPTASNAQKPILAFILWGEPRKCGARGRSAGRGM